MIDRFFYINGNLLLRDSLKMSIPLKILDDNKILVYYYDDNNLLRHKIINPIDTLNEEEYEKLRRRHNSIVKILKS